MQYVNDDMDELFRRAAENYPLDTSGANWNKVLALMEGGTEDKTVSEKKSNSNRRLLWLLLLLPLSFVCNQLYTPGFLNSDGGQRGTETATKDAVRKSASEGVSMDSKVNAVHNKTIEGVSVKERADLPTNKNAEGNDEVVIAGAKKDKAAFGANATSSTKSMRTSYSKGQSADLLFQSNSNTKENGVNASGGVDVYNRTFVYSVQDRTKELRPDVIALSGTATPPVVNSSTEAKSTVIRVSKPKRFYVGVMGGLDATTIKLQKVDSAGFSYGVLGGYQLNKKWSIEVGVYLEKKYYYSDGKYFNTSKIYMPPNSRISEVTGNCKMIEVPLSARYIFSSQKKHQWFGTLGLSSYFMTDENYTYQYYYGTVGPVAHTRPYTKGSTNIFSNISLSGGYIHSIGNLADLRIEPYFKVPLSGLGVGSLPLFSLGLQVGVTKKF